MFENGRTRYYSSPEAPEALYAPIGVSLNAERARLASECANCVRRKNRTLERDLIRVSVIANLRMSAKIRARLSRLPAEMAAEAHSASSIRSADAILRAHIDKVTHEIVDDSEDLQPNA